MNCKIFLTIALLAGCDCTPAQHSTNQSPQPAHPTPIVQDDSYCEAAQANLQAHHCPEGEPTKRGKPFATVCHETQASGVALNPKCLSTIVSCDQIDSCNP